MLSPNPAHTTQLRNGAGLLGLHDHVYFLVACAHRFEVLVLGVTNSSLSRRDELHAVSGTFLFRVDLKGNLKDANASVWRSMLYLEKRNQPMLQFNAFCRNGMWLL